MCHQNSVRGWPENSLHQERNHAGWGSQFKCLELLPHVGIKTNLDVRLFFPMCTLLHAFGISILHISSSNSITCTNSSGNIYKFSQVFFLKFHWVVANHMLCNVFSVQYCIHLVFPSCLSSIPTQFLRKHLQMYTSKKQNKIVCFTSYVLLSRKCWANRSYTCVVRTMETGEHVYITLTSCVLWWNDREMIRVHKML